MKYRLGIFRGLAIVGVVTLGLASGIFANGTNGTSGTAEAAKPSVTVMTHELTPPAAAVASGTCSFTLDIGWEGTAYAHKDGIARLFLFGPDGALINCVDRPIVKSASGGSFQHSWGEQEAGADHRSVVVLYTSRGKDGLALGPMLDRNEQLHLSC